MLFSAGFCSDDLSSHFLSALNMPSLRFAFCALQAGGCPPPPMQPFGQAMTSMKWKNSSPRSTFSMSLSALPRPFATAMRSVVSPAVTSNAFIPSSPRTPHSATDAISYSVHAPRTWRMTASVTPPVTPKITPAPVYGANGASGSVSGRLLKSMPASFIMLTSS